MMLSSIKNESCRNMSQKEYAMGGKAKILVGTQSFRRCAMNSLIHLCLFGDKYEKLMKTEVIYRTKKMCIVHIASLQRIKQLFILSGLCDVEFSIRGIRHSCGGKVNLVS